MYDRTTELDRPEWVRIGLWGLPNRGAAWAFFWFSLAIAIGCIMYGFKDARFFWGGLLVIAAYWYYASIRWMDRYHAWSQ